MRRDTRLWSAVFWLALCAAAAFGASPPQDVPLQDAVPSATVASVKVKVDITHTCKGDLEVSLTVPAASLAAFTGKAIHGNWTLKIRDLAAADLGTPHSWTLSLTAQ
jgi:subtilisin-like proprotein convertase family protein